MLITGVAYALIGIKNGWLYTFFSSGFLASLCTTILIVYVMSPPIRDAVQGAFVVAVLITGGLIGGGATLFRELTEGFGCLLGGFCVSMWLLTLKEGGLLTGTTEKIIFISAFTLGGYMFYFSHHTRGYAQIGLMAFSGATVTVLGIDCFTKAGLKEYWAYIWHLNKDLFPLSAETYPQTKVIRVETALIIIFTAIGVISQLKLWMVVQARRAKRAEEQAELQRQRELEEADIGKQIEEENKREREQWEATYGDKSLGTTIRSGDSGHSTSVEDEKKVRYSNSTVRVVPPEHEIELEDMSSSNTASPPMPQKEKVDGLVVANQQGDDARITVRVARDDDDPPFDDETAPMPEPEEKVWIAGSDGEVRPASPASARRHSQRLSKPAAPEVVPLPFKIPEHVEEAAEKDEDDRSSVATFADDDALSVAPSKRESMRNRLSMMPGGSGKIIRSLSGRSQRSQKSKRTAQDLPPPHQEPAFTESREELVLDRRVSNAGSMSVAATIDGLSEADTDRSGGIEVEDEPRQSIEITAELADRKPEDEADPEGQKTVKEDTKLEPTEEPKVDTAEKETPKPSAADEAADNKSKTTATETQAQADMIPATATAEATEPNTEQTETPNNPQSTATSANSSSRMSLTKDRLPSGLSRVALSYRTNEWAKHLSQAETPEPETLQLNEYPNEEDAAEEQENDQEKQHDKPKKKRESAVPVNVDELQQTAESSILPPPAPASVARPYSSASTLAPANMTRSTSRASISPPAQADSSDPASPVSPVPPNALHATHSFRMKSGNGLTRRASTDVIASPIAEEHAPDGVAGDAKPEDGSPPALPDQPQPQPQSAASIRNSVSVPYASPQTLLGQREMLLRNKSQPMLLGASSTIPEQPEYEQQQQQQHSGSGTPSDTGSVYNYRSSSMPMPTPTPAPAPMPTAPADIDDIPLSQRKEMMRQSSMLSLSGGGGGGGRPNSTMALQQNNNSNPGQAPPRATPTPAAEALPFNSHQPQRRSAVPTAAQREVQLANFRNSVALDLRASAAPALMPTANNSGAAASAGNLLAQNQAAAREREEEVRVLESIERSRSALLTRRDQEAQRREMERREKERADRAREDLLRMRAGAGGLNDAHREAMRRLQGGAKNL